MRGTVGVGVLIWFFGVACGRSSGPVSVAPESGVPVQGPASTGNGAGPQPVHLQVDIDGAGRVASQPAGLDCAQGCVAAFAPGTNVALTATAASDYDFAGFAGACSGNSCSLPMTADAQVIAHFTRRPPARHRLTVRLTGSGAAMLTPTGLTFVTSDGGSIQCPSSCAADFAAGSTVVLRFATGVGPLASSEFVLGGFTGCARSGDSCTATMDADLTVEADIEFRQRVLVHVFVGGAGSGSLSADRPVDIGETNPNAAPAGEWAEFDLPVGESVTLTPSADAGSHVGGWFDNACAPAGSGPCQLTAMSSMPRQISLTVRFDPNVTALYTVRSVPLTAAYAISGGRIAGANDQGAAVYDLATGALTQLSTNSNSAAYAINANGDVAGADGDRPFAIRRGIRTDLTFNGQARAITGSGVVFGFSDTNDGFRLGSDDALTALPGFAVLAANDSEALAGCASGAAIVGTAAAHGSVTPASWHFPCFTAINASGVAVGRTMQVQKQLAFGFSWDGAVHTLGHDDGGLDGALGINASGAIVGTMDSGGVPTNTSFIPKEHAALLSGGSAQDLNFLADASALGAPVLQRAVAIDDQGRIVVESGSQVAVLIPR